MAMAIAGLLAESRRGKPCGVTIASAFVTQRDGQLGPVGLSLLHVTGGGETWAGVAQVSPSGRGASLLCVSERHLTQGNLSKRENICLIGLK